jgi:chromosome partitioning protein
MYVYAVVSQKGGVGKTTTTVNLGAALAEQGKRVLLVDLDPQGSLTAAVGREPGRVGIADVLLMPDRVLGAILPCAGGMHVITATPSLATALLALDDAPDPVHRMSRALEIVADSYDYALIDCPPSLSHATTNALTAADVAMVPLQCEFLSLRGLADLREITVSIQETTNPDLRLCVVATMFDRRTIHAQDVLAEAQSALPGLVCETVIPRTVRLAEAPAVGQTILQYAPESNGAIGYRALAQEVIREDSLYGAKERHSSRYAEPALLRVTV